ncbi:MAG: hypothetical protein GEU98_06355 [Pseudonocardiaceae bacterium]|nr:hypothetical protein [Pseudonocardiaceae bacterium]
MSAARPDSSRAEPESPAQRRSRARAGLILDAAVAAPADGVERFSVRTLVEVSMHTFVAMHQHRPAVATRWWPN